MLKAYRLCATSARRKPGCSVTAARHTVSTDLPKAAGGDDTAPQPVELMLAGLIGCKTATAHFVARHLWPRPNNRIDTISFSDVVAERDERGALTLPICDDPPITAGLLRVSGIVTVRPSRADHPITADDVVQLGELVEKRCPVAAMFHSSGCVLDFEWRLDDGDA